MIANVFHESKMFHQTMFFYLKLCIHTHETYFFDTSCYFVIYIVPAIPFATIAALCNNMTLQVKNITIAEVFRFSHSI